VPHLGPAELAALGRTWQVATDEARLLFVRTADPHPTVARFYWEQLVPPRFEANSFRLRRIISQRLPAMGSVAWQELCPEWTELVSAAAGADLSAAARLTGPDWVRIGLPLASLSWVLPSLVERLADGDRDEALGLLRGIREAFTVPGGAGPGTPAPLPDPGLEISLAEGYKLASVAGFGEQPARPPWLDEARQLLRDSRSWVSRQALHQALTLSTGTADDVPAGGDRHPFVAETIALDRRSVDRAALLRTAGAAEAAPAGAASLLGTTGRDIWRDDVEALHDGGFDLSVEAHRLLALSTLLVNLAEYAHATAVLADRPAPTGPLPDPIRSKVESRERALTSTRLPRCFVSPGHTLTMLDVDCDCEFGLCGPRVRATVGHRKISPAFAQRAAITAGAPLVCGRRTALVRRHFEGVWRSAEVVDADGDDTG
jgi:hypothetical protein